jgi:hypothetical protein
MLERKGRHPKNIPTIGMTVLPEIGALNVRFAAGFVRIAHPP